MDEHRIRSGSLSRPDHAATGTKLVLPVTEYLSFGGPGTREDCGNPAFILLKPALLLRMMQSIGSLQACPSGLVLLQLSFWTSGPRHLPVSSLCSSRCCLGRRVRTNKPLIMHVCRLAQSSNSKFNTSIRYEGHRWGLSTSEMRQEKVLGKPRASGSSGHKACPGSESSSHSPTRMTHLTNGGTETQRVFSTSSMEESPCSIHQPTSSLSVDKTIFKTIKRERNGKKDRKHKPVLGQRKEQHLLFKIYRKLARFHLEIFPKLTKSV